MKVYVLLKWIDPAGESYYKIDSVYATKELAEKAMKRKEKTSIGKWCGTHWWRGTISGFEIRKIEFITE